MKKILLCLFVFIILIEIALFQYTKVLTFSSRNLVIGNQLLYYFSIGGFLICVLSLLNVNKLLLRFVIIIVVVVLGLIAFFEISPLDTFTRPADKEILSVWPDGKKIIVRQRIHAKTNEEKLDTVLVRDLGVFRKIYRDK